MKNPITNVTILIVIVIAFFSFQKFSRCNIINEKPAGIKTEPLVPEMKPVEVVKS